MNGGQMAKGKLGVWEDMTCDCQQCLFIRALPGRFWKTQRQKRGTFARENTKKRGFSCFFAHLIVPLTFGRRHFRSEKRKKKKFFLLFRSLNRTFDLWSKALSLGKTQKKEIFLAFSLT